MNDEPAGRPTCATCIHFFGEGAAIGHCREAPPTMFIVGLRQGIAGKEAVPASFFPPVLPSDSYGRHPDFMLWYSGQRHRSAS